MKGAQISDYPHETIWVDGKPYITVIRWSHIEQIMPPTLFERFEKWSRGITYALMENPQEAGVYPWDLEQFLNGGNPLD